MVTRLFRSLVLRASVTVRLRAWVFLCCALLSPGVLAQAPVANPVSATVGYDSGANPITLNITGGVPNSVAVASAPSNGTSLASGTSITYQPNPGFAGTDSFTYTATNSAGTSAPATVSITVAVPTLSISPATLPSASVGAPYSQAITASGGAAPYTVAITAGALPAGLSLSSAGTLSGTPAAAGTFNFTATATDSSTGTGPFSASRAYSLTVNAPTITISPTILPSASVGAAYSQAITASGGTAPYSFSITAGSLPPGMTLSGTGTLSGTPTAAGTFNFTTTATDSSTGTGPFTGSRAYSLTVGAPTITISPTTLPSASVGAAYSQTITASGGTAPYAFAITAGALPAGLSLSSAGTLSGTPTAGGTFNFTATATDSSGITGPYTASHAYTLVVNAAFVVIPHTPPPDPVVGSPYNYAIPVSGGTAPYTFALTAGTLPPGLSLSSAGVLSGTPIAVGLFTFTVRATDSSTGTGPFTGLRQYTVTVISGTIIISPATMPPATAGTAYSQTLAASGGTAPYTFAVTAGTLPSGLSLSSAGVLSGTPTPAGTSRVDFTITATDSSTAPGPFTGSRPYAVIMLASPITIAPSTSTLPDGLVGTPYLQGLSAAGGTGPYSFSVTAGVLPTGVILDSSGVISGTPTAGGIFSFTVAATDSSPGAIQGYAMYSLTVNAPTITIAPTTLPNALGGTPYSQTITASGGTAPITFSLTAGTLPAGMSFSSAGVLSGTPVAAGTFDFTVTATDSSTGTGPFTGSLAYSLTVDAPTITIAPATLPAGAVDAAYNQAITASGGTAPYAFALTAGVLPVGLSFSSAGVLSGTPTAGGTFNFTITATDAVSFTGSRAYTLTVGAPTITIAPATLPDALGGTPYSQTLTASGGTAPYGFSLTAGTLPAGMSFSSAGVLSGTPSVAGTFGFTITATDSSTGTGPFTGSHAYSLTVNAPTIALSPASLPAAAIGTPYNEALTASGGTAPYGFSLTAGTLPAGMSFSSAGVLSGTPVAAGTFDFTITATDAGAFTGSRAYTLAVGASTIALSPTALPDALGGTPYSQTLTASGGSAPYTFAVTAGALPAGLSLSSAGMLSGTPVAGGIFDFTITATDSSTGSGPFTGSRAYSLTVNASTIALSPTALPDALGGTAYSQTLTASGGTAPYAFAVTAGALPAGLSVSNAGVLSGTPAAGGIFNFTITATDSSAGTGPFTGSRAYSLTVNAPTITLSPAALPAGVVGTPYSQTVTPSGGTAPYSFSVSAGTLPTGTTLSSAGNLGGTPTVAGTYSPTISATDALGFSASVAYSIVIGEAVPVATNDSATVLAGQSVTIPVAANDAGVVSSIAIASAPGVGTATVSGLEVVYAVPATASGTVTFTYTATGPGGTSAPATVTVTVNPIPVAVSRTLTTPAATPVQTELTAGASGGPFTAATVVGVTPADSGIAGIAAVGSGFVLTFTPAAGFAGTATVQFTLDNAFATSNVANVQIEVASRADPTQDPEVIGLIDAQAESTRRFATAQIANFQRRLERLHGADAAAANGIDNSLSLAMARSCVEATLGIDDDCRTQDVVTATQLSAAPGERADAAAPPIAIWIGGTIRSGSQDGRDGRADLDFETDGVSIGADYRVSPRFAFGAGIGYGSDRTDVGVHASRVRGEAYTAALYASYQPGDRVFIDGLFGYQRLSYELARTLGNGGSVVGERDGDQWFGSLSVGADIARGNLQVTPYGRVDMAQAQLDGYVEHGDPLLALQYDAMDVDTLTGNLGVRLDFRHDTGWGVFSPLFRVEYQHEFEDSSSFGIRYADLPSGPVYRGDATQFGRSRWLLGLGATFATDNDWLFRFEVNGLFGGDGERDTGAMLQAEKRY